MRPEESRSGWRNWGDHPIVVLIGAIASLITIIVFLADKFGVAAPLATAETSTTITQTLEPSATISNTTLGIGSTMISDKDGMTLLYVPAGEFTMGSDDGNADEKPVHTIYLDAFWIDQTEVTNAMYTKCVQDGDCTQPSDLTYYSDSKYANHPVGSVSWEAARAYCAWADRSMPTEAEWEKAARGDDARIYPWGNEAPNNNLLNYNSTIEDSTEVGYYPDGASPYGVLDMAGNVWEWVADWYSETYYANSPATNPLGPNSGQTRVLRGGWWIHDEVAVRSAFRVGGAPTNALTFIGFRCAMSATP